MQRNSKAPPKDSEEESKSHYTQYSQSMLKGSQYLEGIIVPVKDNKYAFQCKICSIPVSKKIL
ncbi:MAG TPA: hypothetical protein PLS50_09170, partial [Candidatus Dojkabacteria bacterium]|nr:hypothetical protein [Candidatus Dojkabacteria bacterium]